MDVPLSNVSALYIARFQQAFTLFKAKDYDKSTELCKDLLLNADLPLMIKAWSHLLLAMSDDEQYLHHAIEAERLHGYMAKVEPDNERHQKDWELAKETLEGALEDAEDEVDESDASDYRIFIRPFERQKPTSSELVNQGQGVVNQPSNIKETTKPIHGSIQPTYPDDQPGFNFIRTGSMFVQQVGSSTSMVMMPAGEEPRGRDRTRGIQLKRYSRSTSKSAYRLEFKPYSPYPNMGPVAQLTRTRSAHASSKMSTQGDWKGHTVHGDQDDGRLGKVKSMKK